MTLVVPNGTRPGFTVFLTGLPAAGKSTIATMLRAKLVAMGRPVTLLDGDNVRAVLSPELGFSSSDRNSNIARVAFVAAEVSRHGGACICACIAPYESGRRAARRLVEEAGGRFVLVYVATPLDVCEARDPKGLYAKARAGLISNVTGVNDPYEPPERVELAIDGGRTSPENASVRILTYLAAEGRDVRFTLGYVLGFWVFLTPVFYPLSAVPGSWRPWMLLNPMAPIVEAFKFGVLGVGAIEVRHIAVAGAIVLLVFGGGLTVFLRAEADAADRV